MRLALPAVATTFCRTCNDLVTHTGISIRWSHTSTIIFISAAAAAAAVMVVHQVMSTEWSNKK